MLKLGIIGNPLTHSLSPLMHEAALKALNIEGEYKKHEISEGELAKKLQELKSSGVRGLNITIPFKKKVLTLLDDLTDTAKLTGAVNTITFLENGKTLGDNTDIYGFYKAIPEDIRTALNGKNISILGYGGSAQAIAISILLNIKNVPVITISGRDIEKLKTFQSFVDSKKQELNLKTNIEIKRFEELDLSSTNLLINTTPLGMYPKIEESPISKEKLKELPKNSLVYDIIYNPLETKLLKDSNTLGLKTLNGVDMLVLQGAKSLSLWLEQDFIPTEVMKKIIVR